MPETGWPERSSRGRHDLPQSSDCMTLLDPSYGVALTAATSRSPTRKSWSTEPAGADGSSSQANPSVELIILFGSAPS